MFRDEYNIGSQKNSVHLQCAPKALFTDEKYRNKVLPGFPYVWRGSYWTTVWTDLWPQLRELAGNVPLYGLTQVTRPLFFTTVADVRYLYSLPKHAIHEPVQRANPHTGSDGVIVRSRSSCGEEP